MRVVSHDPSKEICGNGRECRGVNVNNTAGLRRGSAAVQGAIWGNVQVFVKKKKVIVIIIILTIYLFL